MQAKRILTTLMIAMLGVSMISNASADAEENTASALIKELELREAEHPLSENASWNPTRIVVNLPTFFAAQIPDFEAQLKNAAGDVDLVIDQSNDFILDKKVLTGADAVIGVCSSPIMENADAKLLWVHNYFVGMERCTGLSDEQLKKVTFTNTKRLSGPAIAEHTIAMMMALAKGLPTYQRAQIAAKWDRPFSGAARFGELKGKTMLVVGLGGIGTQIAMRAHGLGMRVIATRNSSRTGPDYVEYVGLADELLTLAAKADVIVNALPLTAKTTGLFDKEFFSNTKSGAIFLSVGRGKSTVTADLIAALESKQLYGAGLDVTDPEPLPESSPLWGMENVIITPHVSAATIQSLERTAILTVENLRRYVAGEALVNVVNIQAGY
jgi:phosphoglycerate dehydrogenase-like enzyme